MAIATNLTRRAAFLGAAASTVALAVPAAHAAHMNETASDKVNRLCQELSEALDGFGRGTFRAIIEPASKSHMPVLLQNLRLARRDDATLGFLKNAPVNARAFYHATEFGKALQQVSGGGWRVTDINDNEPPGATTRPKIVMFVQHPGKTGVAVPEFNFD